MSNEHKGLTWKIIPGCASAIAVLLAWIYVLPEMPRPARYAFSGCLIEPNFIASALDFFVYWGAFLISALCCGAPFGCIAFGFTHGSMDAACGSMDAACGIRKFIVNYKPSPKSTPKPVKRRELRMQSKVTVGKLHEVNYLRRLRDRVIRVMWSYAYNNGPKIGAVFLSTIAVYLVVFAYTSTAICRPGHLFRLATTDFVLVCLFWLIPIGLMNIFFEELFGDDDSVRTSLTKRASTLKAHHALGALWYNTDVCGCVREPSGLDIDSNASDHSWYNLNYRKGTSLGACVNVRIYDNAVLFLWFPDLFVNKCEVIETARFEFNHMNLDLNEIDAMASNYLEQYSGQNT